MALTRWRPWGPAATRPLWGWPGMGDLWDTSISKWMPSMDVYPQKDDLVVKVELPGPSSKS